MNNEHVEHWRKWNLLLDMKIQAADDCLMERETFHHGDGSLDSRPSVTGALRNFMEASIVLDGYLLAHFTNEIEFYAGALYCRPVGSTVGARVVYPHPNGPIGEETEE